MRIWLFAWAVGTVNIALVWFAIEYPKFMERPDSQGWEA